VVLDDHWNESSTNWHSEKGIAKAKKPTKLVIINDLAHADLYDKVDEAGKKLVDSTQVSRIRFHGPSNKIPL
jgi:hypothetical protein